MNKELIRKENMHSSILKDESLVTLKKIFDSFEAKYALKPQQIIELIHKKTECILVPIDILKTNLGPLESIVKYLKEEKDLNFSQISALLNRDITTILTSYNNAVKKKKERFILKKSEFLIPVSILKNRELSISENITKYLHEELGLGLNQIASVLKRNNKTIWTFYYRVKKKIAA
ncbi:MAG: hypothetical protein KAU20_03300 [Nanoarchaeota archaeon]|nr:hypothetical protein [Nanoarchaeota archaeon]